MLANTHPRFHEIQALLAGSDFVIKPKLSIFEIGDDDGGGKCMYEDIEAEMKMFIPIANNKHLKFQLNVGLVYTLSYVESEDSSPAHIPGPYLMSASYFFSIRDNEENKHLVIISNTTFEFNNNEWPTVGDVMERIKEDIRENYPACPF